MLQNSMVRKSTDATEGKKEEMLISKETKQNLASFNLLII